MASALTLPIRARLSSSPRCLAATWVRRSTCWVEQPPQTPKCGQSGARREAEARRISVTRARSNFGLVSSSRASTSSPASAPSTNTTLPALRATPRPAASSASISSFIPELQEFAPVRLAKVLEVCFQDSGFFSVLVFRERPPQELVAQVQQVGVRRVGLAIVTDLRSLAREPGFPDFRAAYADLAGQARELRHLVQRRVVARLVHREHVHQVQVPRVVARDVVVVAEVAVVVAGFLEGRRRQ